MFPVTINEYLAVANAKSQVRAYPSVLPEAGQCKVAYLLSLQRHWRTRRLRRFSCNACWTSTLWSYYLADATEVNSVN